MNLFIKPYTDEKMLPFSQVLGLREHTTEKRGRAMIDNGVQGSGYNCTAI